MRLRAYAKVNLYLDVLRRRPDGYHDILTLFQSVSLCDELVVRRSKEIWVECDMPGVPSGVMNLAYKAAKLLKDVVGLREGVSVEIRKRIPPGAGLGGGSADAAAVLVAMNELFSLNLEIGTLMELGAELGADVPFCISGGTAIGEGRGDVLTKLKPLEGFWLVLAYPGVHISTGWAYGRLRLTEPRVNARILIRLKEVTPEAVPDLLFNVFEDVVFPEHPEIARLKDRMLELGARGALMSGSGSTVFGLFFDEAEARRALAAISKEVPFSQIVRPVPRGVEID
ncbi:4-(cytidine 5'-diphospho)-2-C-methyl-D-erythritol kinase [Candidatus Poribacteria bacterium]|nr:MAG: 4-(cytidine 5'-diphospho)-2-C-methyl-D-erythritol kinase [Candidatus Poribacteria bacterium]